jgi:restriction system protein
VEFSTFEHFRRIAELIIDHGVGVAEEHAYSVKKIDTDYFDEGES